MTVTPKVQRIIDWRESFTKMPDQQFFEIIRMYLGEIKTPYNKQNLIDDISSFLCTDENKAAIIHLLCNGDLKILAAVRFIPHVSRQKMESYCTVLFGGLFSKLSLAEHLANLMQRLLVFEFTNPLDGSVELRINPLLEDSLFPVVPIELLLPKPSVRIERSTEEIFLTPQLLAAFISYVFMHPDLCKADGSLKKKNSSELSAIFGLSLLPVLDLLLKAFCNLNLFHQAEKLLEVDWERLKELSLMPEMSQYAYLCVACCGHFSRSTLHANAQLLFDVLCAVLEEGYEKSGIMNLALLLKENSQNDSVGGGGRFAQIVARAEGFSDMTTELVMEGMIDACIEFGLLHSVSSGDSEILYVPQAVTAVSRRSPFLAEKNHLLSIDAGYIVTILPGLTLADFLPLVRFLSVTHYDTAVSFEICKKSVMHSFDAGMTPDVIKEQLMNYSSFPVPQNIQVSLDDWNNSYSSASLFKGYVLKVSKENIVKTRNDRVLSPYIVEEISEGVFLLDFSSDEESNDVLGKSGLDFVGKIRERHAEQEVLGFMRLRKHDVPMQEETFAMADAPFKLSSTLEQNKTIEGLKKQVVQMDIPLEQKEGLLDRVEPRIVVNPDQLRGSSVRFECREAGGMDYQGKMHVIEDAIQSKVLLEVHLEEEGTLVGMPVMLMKHEHDADLELSFVDDSSRILTVGKISYLKKIKKSLSFF